MTCPTAAATSLRVLKRTLRKEMSRVLSELPSETVSGESRAVANYILSSELYARSERISVYLSMSTAELQTSHIVRGALRDGKKLFIPLIHPSRDPATDTDLPPRTEMSMLRLRSLEEYEGLKKNGWGIPEPDPQEAGEDALADDQPGLDLILMPGVAFDRQLNRLGHGKGFYDRYITRANAHAEARSQHSPTLVALALRAQLLPPEKIVPTDALDQPLDALVSADGWVWPRGEEEGEGGG